MGKLLILRFDGLGDYSNTSSKVRQRIQENLPNNTDPEYKNSRTLTYGEYEEPVNIWSLGLLKYNSRNTRDAKNFIDRALKEYKDLGCEPKIMLDIHSFGAYFAGNVIEYLNKTFEEKKPKEHESEENKLFCQFYNDIHGVFLNQPFISNKIKDLKGVATILAPLSFTRKTNQESYKNLVLNKKHDFVFRTDDCGLQAYYGFQTIGFLCPKDAIVNYNSQQSFLKDLKDVSASQHMVSISEKALSHHDIDIEKQKNFIKIVLAEESLWDIEYPAKELRKNDKFKSNLSSIPSRVLNPKLISRLNEKMPECVF